MGRHPSVKQEKGKSDFKVVKKCTECEKEIPVACKICPLCKSYITPSKSLKTPKEEEKDTDAKVRRTERIRRDRPDFFNSLQLDNQFKKKRKRKESLGSVSSISSTTSKPPVTNVITKEPSEDGEAPKRKRGRPRSVASVSTDLCEKNLVQQTSSKDLSDSETKSPTPEEDWYAHLPAEKFMQYKIILAEINRKFSSQNFNPV